jgi:hypothetical protein
MTYGTEQRALIADGREIAKETVTPVGEWDGSREEPAFIGLSFHERQILISYLSKEMRGLPKPPLEVCAAEIVRPQVMNVSDVERGDGEEVWPVLRRLRDEPGIEHEHVAGGEPKELSPLSRGRIAVCGGPEVRVDMRVAPCEPRRKYRRERGRVAPRQGRIGQGTARRHCLGNGDVFEGAIAKDRSQSAAGAPIHPNA